MIARLAHAIAGVLMLAGGALLIVAALHAPPGLPHLGVVLLLGAAGALGGLAGLLFARAV